MLSLCYISADILQFLFFLWEAQFVYKFCTHTDLKEIKYHLFQSRRAEGRKAMATLSFSILMEKYIWMHTGLFSLFFPFVYSSWAKRRFASLDSAVHRKVKDRRVQGLLSEAGIAVVLEGTRSYFPISYGSSPY